MSKGNREEKLNSLLEFIIGRGDVGATNVELVAFSGHRFGSLIYSLKENGYRFAVISEGDSIVRYKYQGKESRNSRKKANEVISEEFRKSGGAMSYKKLMALMDEHGIHNVYKPNRRNP